jgi:hypothetical protein
MAVCTLCLTHLLDSESFNAQETVKYGDAWCKRLWRISKDKYYTGNYTTCMNETKDKVGCGWVDAQQIR